MTSGSFTLPFDFILWVRKFINNEKLFHKLFCEYSISAVPTSLFAKLWYPLKRYFSLVSYENFNGMFLIIILCINENLYPLYLVFFKAKTALTSHIYIYHRYHKMRSCIFNVNPMITIFFIIYNCLIIIMRLVWRIVEKLFFKKFMYRRINNYFVKQTHLITNVFRLLWEIVSITIIPSACPRRPLFSIAFVCVFVCE